MKTHDSEDISGSDLKLKNQIREGGSSPKRLLLSLLIFIALVVVVSLTAVSVSETIYYKRKGPTQGDAVQVQLMSLNTLTPEAKWEFTITNSAGVEGRWVKPNKQGLPACSYEELNQKIIQNVIKSQPTRLLIVAHKFNNPELLRLASALSAVAQVTVVICDNKEKHNDLDDPFCQTIHYEFSRLIRSTTPLNGFYFCATGSKTNPDHVYAIEGDTAYCFSGSSASQVAQQLDSAYVPPHEWTMSWLKTGNNEQMAREALDEAFRKDNNN